MIFFFRGFFPFWGVVFVLVGGFLVLDNVIKMEKSYTGICHLVLIELLQIG